MKYKLIINRLFKNSFIKNVSILASGAIIGQIVVIASSPLLTRLYSEESFGILAVFTSVCTILSLFSTGRYELAVVLPESNKKSIQLLRLIIYVASGISLFYLCMIILLKDVLKIQDPTHFLVHSVAYLGPFYIFSIAILSGLIYWNQRKKKYTKISKANAVHSIANTIVSIVLGVLMIRTGMIWGLIASTITVIVYYLIGEKSTIHALREEKNVSEVAKEYKNFPRYMIFSDFSLNANQQLTPIMFSSLYNTAIVGHYSLANRMLRLPNIIITGSIANVFRNDAIDEIRKQNNCKQLYIATLKKLFFLSFPVYLVIFIVSPFVFKIFFGENWELAGEFGQIISIFLFVEFIATPLNTLFYVRSKQKELMIIQTTNLLISIAMISLGALLYKDPKMSLILYSINAIFFNIILLTRSFMLSKHP